ncbi:MAG TPA: hypothetical protein VLE70_06795, partial [Anaerolineae bacterium]|nr:hypothetical protein [Anaerolineae bacterium]
MRTVRGLILPHLLKVGFLYQPECGPPVELRAGGRRNARPTRPAPIRGPSLHPNPEPESVLCAR